MQRLHLLLEELYWVSKKLGFTWHAGFRAHCDFPHSFPQRATLLQPHQLCLSLGTWAHLTCWTMPGSTTPFQTCIISLRGKNSFPPASKHRNTIYTNLLLLVVLYLSLHSVSFIPTSNLLAEERATEKGLKLRLLDIIKSPGRFFAAVTRAVLYLCCTLLEKLPAGEV